MPYYAVKIGKNPGIYKTLSEYNKQIKNFSGAIGKKFSNEEEALNFIKSNTKKPKKLYYAVRIGRNPGIYDNINDYNEQVKNYPGATGKKFKSEEKALNFINTPVKKIYYAVRIGRNPGIYNNEEDYKKQIEDFPNALGKKFNLEEAAIYFVYSEKYEQKENKQQFYYAVRAGRNPGIYTSSIRYREQVLKFSKCASKRFKNITNALEYMYPDSFNDKKYFYAVRVGKNPGVYEKKEDWILQIVNHQNNDSKVCLTKEEAENYIKNDYDQNNHVNETINCQIELKELLPNNDNTILCNNTTSEEDNCVNNNENKDNENIESNNLNILQDFKITSEHILSIKGKEESVIHAHIDGSYIVENDFYSYTVIFTDNNGNIVETISGTNNSFIEMKSTAAELYAAAIAIQVAVLKKYNKIIIHYDCKTIEQIATGRHTPNANGTKSYLNFINKYKDDIDIEFAYNQGHKHHFFNNTVNSMSRTTAKTIEETQKKIRKIQKSKSFKNINFYHEKENVGIEVITETIKLNIKNNPF